MQRSLIGSWLCFLQNVCENIQRVIASISSSVYINIFHLCENLWHGRWHVNGNGYSLYRRSLFWNYWIECDLYKWKHAGIKLYYGSLHYISHSISIWIHCASHLLTGSWKEEQTLVNSIFMLHLCWINFILNGIWVHHLLGLACLESFVVFWWDIFGVFCFVFTRDCYWCYLEILFLFYCVEILPKNIF